MKKFFENVANYISSFIPLYFLIIVKELIDIANGNLTFNITNTVMISLNSIFILVGVYSFVINYFWSDYQDVKIISIKNITSQNFLPYFPIFVLFAIAFELEFINMAVVYILILIMLGSVYIKNELFYINPFLNIIGFISYEITYETNGKKLTKKLYSLRKISGDRALVNSHFIKQEKDILA